VAHQLLAFEEQQLRLLRLGLAPPFVEGRQRGDAFRNDGVEEGVYQLLVDQHVGPPRFVLQVLDVAHQLLVVSQELPLAQPVLVDLAQHQRMANQQFARQLGIHRSVVDSPLGVQQQAVQRDAFPRHHLTRSLLPMRLEDVPADEMRADLFQPLGLDLGDAAREQSRGFDELGGDDPAPGLLDQRRARMDEILDAAGAEIMRLCLALEADVAEQTGQQRLVDGFVAGRQLVFLPAVLRAQRMQLAMNVAPLAQAQPRQKLAPAPLALLVRRLVLPDLVRRRPQLEIREELGLLVLPFRVRLVRGARLFLRAFARVLHRQRGGDDQHLLQTAILPRGENHAADLRVERKRGQLMADRRQFLAGLVDRAQLGQQLIAVGDHARQRRLEEGEGIDIAEVQRLHAQDDAGQA